MESVIRLKINSEDIDLYGHLNNARYSLYFEQGRDKFARDFNLDACSLKDRNLGFQVRRASYEFESPVYEGQEVNILTSLERGDRKSTFIICQSMMFDDSVMATARAEYFFANLGTCKPVAPPKDIVGRFFSE